MFIEKMNLEKLSITIDGNHGLTISSESCPSKQEIIEKRGTGICGHEV